MIFVYCEDKGFLFSKQILFQKRLFRVLHTTHKYPNQGSDIFLLFLV